MLARLLSLLAEIYGGFFITAAHAGIQNKIVMVISQIFMHKNAVIYLRRYTRVRKLINPSFATWICN